MRTPNFNIPLVNKLMQEFVRQLLIPATLVVIAFVLGTVGYVILGGGKWSVLDAAYMTSITLTTVGYGEVLAGMDQSPVARLYTLVLMWAGMGVTLFAISSITAFVVERNLGRLYKERKMEKQIAALKNHYIVCGAGRTGVHIIHELFTTKRPFVVVEISEERLEHLGAHYDGILTIHGDATDEETLERAGIQAAGGLIANVNEDSRNLLISVQARFVRPDLTIVARAEDNALISKFERAGADYVVSPSFIGGMRMASQMLRPNTVTFLDRMLRGQDPSIRVDEATVEAGSKIEGKTLAQAEIFSRTGLRPIAFQPAGASAFQYNPSGDEVLTPGSIIFVVGNPDQLASLRDLCHN